MKKRFKGELKVLAWVIIIAAILLIGGVVAMFVITVPIARNVYENQLVRSSADKWGRVCSAPDNEEQMRMWNSGNAWADEHRAYIKVVQIENDGLKLYGEYFDQASDKCAIILPGRCECLKYSYYYAKPYFDAGMNVLVIDARAHGNSDGKYSTVGVAESRDCNAWIRHICNTFSVNEVYLHGICVGCSTAILAMTAKDAPDQIKALIADGCFVSFRETFKRHMIADHRPLFPVLDLVMLEIYRQTGANVFAAAPIRHIGKIDRRVLFLFGEKDIFSVPKKSRKLFAACGSKDKQIVWMPEGAHSHIRLNNTEQYDNAIKAFVNHG